MRSTAEARRSEAAREAMTQFARGGYDGTPVGVVAEALGVSQPYLFKLFGSKTGLFIACVELCYDLIEQNARARLAERAAAGHPGTLDDIGYAFRHTIAEADLLRFQLQAWAASATHPEIRTVVAARFSRSLELSRELTGASADEVNEMFARGARLVVSTALGIELLS
ncbi:TetR/AcrR family transcriptional regulator [Herbiconiux sp. CPCC 205716]|uniref:TetR/AcrR family transcriptional regulator n=1 Tax=Herbiconiux gentiana TaxID=2970912 RepID=A0ABT2GIQ2_9MICO|nr:TetR/AcrR family transcriptional regulator [Herbiconiux gentiana]MCS5716110.1 TetR/AcrR family transcriptional regulator [Herbiconiux gentiana]